MSIKIKRKHYYFLPILVLGLFLPVFDAHAQLFGIGSFAYGAVSNAFAYGLSIIFTILGKLLAVLVSMLDWVVRIRIYTDLPVIQSSWKIMRDFANMLFIIALIVMAYGTIFNVPKYDFRSLLPRFITIAVLINFSLVLSGLMIDATQILNNTFLNAMGDISGRLGQGLSPAQLLPNTANLGDAQGIVDIVGASIITLFFAIWFLFAFIVSVAVPLAVAFARIPILWALLIVSPMAWLLSILPATKKAYDNWWKQFLGWNLFLPYYLFFLYFALFLLSQQDAVLAGMLRGSAGQAVINQDFSKFGIQNSVTFGLLFYYILVGIFLIGGTKVAMDASTFSGTGIMSVAKWGRGVAMRRLGVTATQRAAQMRLAEIQKEGLPGRFGLLYGGERALEEQTARMARRFGVKGADIKVQQAFLDRTSREYSDLETKYRLGQVSLDVVKRTANSGSATDARVYAARKMLAKTGQLDANISQRTFSELGNNALAMEDFAKTASGAKWSSMNGSEVRSVARASGSFSSLATPSGTAARREAIKHVQDDKMAITDIRTGAGLTPFDTGELREYITLMGGPTTYDAKELVKSVGKYRPDLVYDLSTDPAFASLNPGTVSRTDFIKRAVDRADYETLAHMPRTLWEDVSGDFQTALQDRYNRRPAGVDRSRFKTALLDEIAKTPDSPAKTAAANTIMP